MAKNNIKDARYEVVKSLITNGQVTEFRQIFISLPKSILYQDLGMNSERFNKLMHHVEGFVLKDIFTIANLIGVEKDAMLQLIMNQHYVDLEEKGISDKN